MSTSFSYIYVLIVSFGIISVNARLAEFTSEYSKERLGPPCSNRSGLKNMLVYSGPRSAHVHHALCMEDLKSTTGLLYQPLI